MIKDACLGLKLNGKQSWFKEYACVGFEFPVSWELLLHAARALTLFTSRLKEMHMRLESHTEGRPYIKLMQLPSLRCAGRLPRISK